MPIIEYTLEFLAGNGVQEVFIYCSAHSEEIETYISESPRWSPKSVISPFSSLDFIRVADATSIGDFLRDLDKRALVEGDFILVHGDVVSNIPLADILAKHKARREANRDVCMTMVLRTIGDEPHRAGKARVITPVFFVDPEGRCLQYDEIHPFQKDRKLRLDRSLFDHGEFYMRADLLDCGIDICTPEVLALWSESFDYELPRKNFLHGVLKDWELNGKMIYTEILDHGYAARASNLQMYDCIARDILGRWAFPLAPDTNLVHGQSFKRIKEGSFLEDGVVIARGSKVTKSVIGRSTSLGSGTAITRSIIGRRCRIGKDVKIENSHIWDDVVIEDGASVVHSIMASSAAIGKGARIPEGTLISYNVRIGDGQQLAEKPFVRISLLANDKTLLATDTSLVGQGGKGALYEEPRDEDEDEEERSRDPAVLQNSLLYSLADLNISSESVSTFASHDSDDSDEDGSFSDPFRSGDIVSPRSRLSSFASDTSAQAASSSGAFHIDAVHGLVDALRADDSNDFGSARLEFMGLRLANNASDAAMRRAIAVAFAHRAAELLSPEHGGLEFTKAADKTLTAKDGAVKFISDVGVGGDDAASQAEFALALQKALLGVKGLEATRASALLAALLQQLYNQDVLEEDGILTWWGDKRSTEGESLVKLREKCRILVEWLENADEEDSEEEDSD